MALLLKVGDDCCLVAGEHDDLGTEITQRGGPKADTWVLGDDYEWYQACNPCNPGPLLSAAGANNSYHTLLFGGINPDSDDVSNSLWIWNGYDWDLVPVAGPVPDPRFGAGFAFDGRDFILFGGNGGGGLHGDTWAFHFDHPAGIGSWELICEVCGPEPRFWSGFAGLCWDGDPWPGAILPGGYGADPSGADGPAALTDQWARDGYRWILTDAGFGTFPVDFGDPSTWVYGVPYSPRAASAATA